MKKIRLGFVATTIATVVVVASCTTTASTNLGGSAEEAPDVEVVKAVEISEVEAPPEVNDGSTRTLGGSLVAATGKLPGLLVTRTVEPGGEAILSVSTMTKGGDLTALDLGLTVDGEVRAVSAAGSEELTAISGSKWLDGQVHSFILTSPERNTWTESALPATLSGSHLVSVTVDERVAFAAVTNVDSTAGVVVVDEGKVTVSALPSGPDDLVRISGIAAKDGKVVVTGGVADRGESAVAVSWLSTDHGATFSAATEIPDASTTITGVVHAAGEWVITGLKLNEAGTWRPASWVSPNGVDWDLHDHSWNYREGEWWPWGTSDFTEASIGEPVVGPNGSVHVWATSGGPYGAIYTRNSSGFWWTHSGHSTTDDDAAASDVNVDGVLAVSEGGDVALLRLSASWAELTLITDSGWDSTTLSERDEPMYLNDIDISSQGVGFSLAQTVFMLHDDGWEKSAVGLHILSTASRLETKSMPDPLDVTWVASDPASDMQVLGGYQGIQTHVLKRTRGSEAEEVDADLSDIYGIRRIVHLPGVGYVLAANERSGSQSSSGANQVTFLTSSDGSSWERTRADELGNTDSRDSAVLGICALPDDGALAVGVSDRLATAWKFTNTDWHTHTIGDLPSGSTALACVSTSDAVVVTINVGGGQEMWRTIDGVAYEKVNTMPHHVSMSQHFASTDSTSLAGGHMNTPEYSGAALFFSKDAVTWRWLPIPASDHAFVGVHEGVAHVVVPGAGGVRFFQVDDLSAAWEAAEPIS